MGHGCPGRFLLNLSQQENSKAMSAHNRTLVVKNNIFFNMKLLYMAKIFCVKLHWIKYILDVKGKTSSE